MEEQLSHQHMMSFDVMADKMVTSFPFPSSSSSKPETWDVIIDGGLFNGSYAIGVLFLLQAMQRHHLIRVRRISGASVGAIVGLLFFADSLHLAVESYERLVQLFRDSALLHVPSEMAILYDQLPPERALLRKIQKRLFISYYDVEQLHKVVRCRYRSKADVIDCVIRSSFIPFVTKHPHVFYQKRYADGIMPALFSASNSADKTLYIDLHSNCSRIIDCFRIKHEPTNVHRILTGMVDAFTFLTKHPPATEFCRFVGPQYPVPWLFRWKQWTERMFFLVFSCLALGWRMAGEKRNQKYAWYMLHHIFGVFCRRYLV